MIDLDRLKTFLVAAELLSFTEAAKQLHVSQPTISHHIRLLEKDFGVQLFDREGNSLQLTDAGRMLLPMARQMLHQAMDIRDMMLSLDNEVAGQLYIACSTTAGKYILPLLAARFRQRHADIQVTILACRYEQLIERLTNGEAHISVTSSELTESGVQSQPFFEDSITLIVPSSHPWATRTSIEPDELPEEPMLIMEPMSGTRRVLLTELAKHDIAYDDLNILMEIGNAEAIVNTVRQGYGIAFVSNLAAAAQVELGHVVMVPVVNMEMNRTIYMVRQEISPPYRPQELFWRFVHDEANVDLLRLPKQTG
ncbi:MAG: LysR family transcriptional regulator [Chloroflexota bacterium]